MGNLMMATPNTDDATLELGLPATSSVDTGTALDSVIDYVLPSTDTNIDVNDKLNSQVQHIETRVNHVEDKVNAVHEKVEEISSRPEQTETSSRLSPESTENATAEDAPTKTLADLTEELSNFL